MMIMMFSAQAQTDTKAGLQKAFEDMSYSLTVEWDQEDKNFYTEHAKKFQHAIQELQAQGMTRQQMLDFVKSKASTTMNAQELETVFNSIVINKMSAEEASVYMVEMLKKSQVKGASWNGDVMLYAAIGVLLVVASVSLALSGLPGASGNTGGYCRETYSCKTTCYGDYYYGRNCYEDCGYICL